MLLAAVTTLRRVAAVPAFEDGDGAVPTYTELGANFGWNVRPDIQLALTSRSRLAPSHPEIGGLAARREIARTMQATVRMHF